MLQSIDFTLEGDEDPGAVSEQLVRLLLETGWNRGWNQARRIRAWRLLLKYRFVRGYLKLPKRKARQRSLSTSWKDLLQLEAARCSPISHKHTPMQWWGQRRTLPEQFENLLSDRCATPHTTDDRRKSESSSHSCTPSSFETCCAPSTRLGPQIPLASIHSFTINLILFACYITLGSLRQAAVF